MDNITRALIRGGFGELTLINVTDVVNVAAHVHCVSGEKLKTLGGLLAAGAYISSFLKTDLGSVSLTVHEANGDCIASVSSDSQLHVRGYVEESSSGALAGADLTVIRDDGYLRPFIGACRLESGELSEIISGYFCKSEQIPTFASLTVELDEKGLCSFAGGAVVQALPGAEDEDLLAFAGIVENIAETGVAAVCREGEEGEYFKELSKGYNPVKTFPVYKCNCSREKVQSALIAVGKKELDDICATDNQVLVHCHYCNKDYIFTKKDVGDMFSEKG